MTAEEFNKKYMVKVGDRQHFNQGDGNLGSRCRLLALLATHVGEGCYLTAYASELPMCNSKLYPMRLKLRVWRHLQRELDEISRTMNKKCGRRYVHWSNGLGQYFDEGE